MNPVFDRVCGNKSIIDYPSIRLRPRRRPALSEEAIKNGWTVIRSGGKTPNVDQAAEEGD